jgi:hypothetical protein
MIRVILIRVTSLIPLALVLSIVFSNQCKAPWDWKPEHDTLTDPPDAPKILEPRPDTTLWWASPGSPTVSFDWTAIADCEYHEIDIDTSGYFMTPTGNPYRIVIRASVPPQVVQSFFKEMQRRYYFRIRAVSKAWHGGATAWSQSRSFTLRYQPGW